MHALTLIAFVGSVFSPYYAHARRRHGEAQARADEHCAVNLSLYRKPAGAGGFQRLWAMTERGASAVQRQPGALRVGPSQLAWQSDGSLLIDIDERAAPWPQRLRGLIRVQPGAQPAQAFTLDAGGHHTWQPISPSARVTVDFDRPRLAWQGDAYLDANHGRRPLERDFLSWQWQRSALPGHRSRVLYEVQPRQGPERSLALGIDRDGTITALPLPPWRALPNSAWGVERSSRGLQPLELLGTLESGPFYCRSLLRDGDDGALTVHESLSLQRFDQRWVQALLPFRMPRWTPGR